MIIKEGTMLWLRDVASQECIECTNHCEEFKELIEDVERVFPDITNCGLGCQLSVIDDTVIGAAMKTLGEIGEVGPKEEG